MTATSSDFTTIAADFLRCHVLPTLHRELAALHTGPGADDRASLVARITAWARDVDAGQEADALEPANLALALETVWLLAVVDIIPIGNGRFVDVVMRPDLARALDLAVAAADTLDMLRETSVGDAFRRRQFDLLDIVLNAMLDPMAGVAGTA